MKSLNIITTVAAFDFEAKKITIGGVQTYIQDLAELAASDGYNVAIFAIDCMHQKSISFLLGRNINVIRVFGNKTLFKNCNQNAFDNVYSQYNVKGALFVVASDQMDIQSTAPNVITIQHGIAFDIPGYLLRGKLCRFKSIQMLMKLSKCLKNVRRFYYVKNTVCVDYNFFNWFRTLGTIYGDTKIEVIPNYSSNSISKEALQDKLAKETSIMNIVFARRFVEARGPIVFANVVKRLYDEGYNFNTTFAGDGRLLSQIQNQFKDEKRISFESFSTKESIEFHKKFDVAVVPTIYSEGTSLSLNEAMSAGCFPICTYVGGMSNMILNGYNGFSVYPDEEHLYMGIKKILDMDKSTFRNIVNNAYETSVQAFGKQRWDNQWLDFLSQVQEKCVAL